MSIRSRFLTVLWGVAMTATALIAPLKTGFSMSLKVDQYKLDNGMEVLVIPDHRAPVVTSMVWYRVGAADDPQGKAGIAHFLEHLMFKGTDKIPPGEFSKIVRRRGGEDNAFTSYDFTAYYQRISKDHLDFVLSLEADRMQNIKLSDAVVLPERDVVKEERRSRTENDPTSLFFEQLNAVFYIAHPYRRPIIGWMDDVASLTREDALAFYHTYYTPQNAILIVSGDVSGEEVLSLAQKHFGVLKNTASPPPRKRTPEPPALSERRVIMEDERVSVPQLHQLFLAPSYRAAPSGRAEALDVLAEVLGGSPTSRLYRLLVEGKKVASHIDASYSGDSLDNGTFGISASPVPGGNVDVLEKEIHRVLSDFLQSGVTQEEVTRAKNRLLADTIYALDSQFRLAYLFGVARTSGRSVEDVLAWDQKIAQVTPQEVMEAARSLLIKNPPTVGILHGPSSLPQPKKTAQ